MRSIETRLLWLVQDAIRRSDPIIRSQVIEDPKISEKLLALGWIARLDDGTGNYLTPDAYEVVFARFEEIECPTEVQKWVDDLKIAGLRWRRARGYINVNSAYPPVRTIFITDDPAARMSSWFHELGHVVFNFGQAGPFSEDRNGVNREKAARLALTAKSLYRITPSQANPPIDGERCIQLTPSASYGFTHHGPETEDEELWAILFGEYCSGFELLHPVREILEEIISDLKST